MYENFRSINSFPWEKKKSWSIPHVKSLVGKYIVCIICKSIYTNNIGFFFLRILHTVHLPPIVITKCFFMWFSCQSFFDRFKKKKKYGLNTNWCYFSSLSLGFRVWLTAANKGYPQTQTAPRVMTVFLSKSTATEPSLLEKTNNVFLIHSAQSSCMRMLHSYISIYFKHWGHV